MSSCLTPLVLVRNYRTMDGGFTDVVPCGKCPNCTKRRVQSWVFRLSEEQKHSRSAVFLTLTYDDENIPYTENGYHSLDKTDLQKFFKRLRKQIAEYSDWTEKLKYYAVGEYGTNTYRPHYHVILFNLPTIYDSDLLGSVWTHGHVRIDECNGATIGYVTGYVNKKSYSQKIEEGDDRMPEFSLMSKKMGIQYLTKNRVEYYQRKKISYIITEDGKKTAMPRYFKEKLYSKLERQKIAKEIQDSIVPRLEKQFENERHKIEYIKYQFQKKKRKELEKRNQL